MTWSNFLSKGNEPDRADSIEEVCCYFCPPSLPLSCKVTIKWGHYQPSYLARASTDFTMTDNLENRRTLEEQKNTLAREKNNEESRPSGDSDLLSLMESWDVETFLEETDNDQSQCKYFQQTGSCPYQEVGCMFQHHEEDSQEQAEEQGEVKDVKEETKTRVRERLSARSRNKKMNEERFRRLRDLSISCSWSHYTKK